MARATNFLNDLAMCVAEVIDGQGKQDSEGNIIPYEEETKQTLLMLVDFIKGGMWTNNETKRFVARNFNTSQSKLSALWASLYPNESRTTASFRMLSAEVNKQMYSIFPSDLLSVFMSEDKEKLEVIRSVVRQYSRASTHIENTFISDLYKYLVGLPSTSNKYTLEECDKEIQCLVNLSKRYMNIELSKCDKDKLAFVYATIIKPIIFKQQFNKERVLFAVEYLDRLEAYNDENRKEVEPTIESKQESTQAIIDTDIEEVIQSYIQGAEVDEFDFANPEIVKLLARCDKQYIKNKLSGYRPSEVALTLKEWKAGNSTLEEVYNKEVKSAKQNNMVGNYMFLPDVLEILSDYVKDVEEAEKINPKALVVLLDYLTDTVYTRFDGVAKEDLKKAIKELNKEKGVGVALLEKLRGIDIAKADENRVREMIKAIKSE